MESDGRIIVMRPGAVATAAVVRSDGAEHHKSGSDMIAGHDIFLFVARGEGKYRVNGREGVLRPNTLLAVPAGTFACELGEDREMFIVAVREPASAPDDPNAFSPFVERQLSAPDGRRWYARMAEFADRAAAGRFDSGDVQRLKGAYLPYVWRREPHETLQAVFASIWDHLAEPLTLERLAADAGYSANYLNDLARANTGRALGSWIADMRMARARTALEHTELPIADIGVMCGYDDPAYFSRAFRRAHGVPPATWRIASRPVDSRYAAVTISIDLLHEIELRAVLPERAYSFAS